MFDPRLVAGLLCASTMGYVILGKSHKHSVLPHLSCVILGMLSDLSVFPPVSCLSLVNVHDLSELPLQL